MHFPYVLWIAILTWLTSVCHLLATPISPAFPEFPEDYKDLSKQDKALIRDLILLDYPGEDWRELAASVHPECEYDVVIIGGGMAGLTAGAALFKEGIYRIKIFDENDAGLEGPWVTYARMKTLRSPKEIMGPALGIPHLTFYAWFEAKCGAKAWDQLEKIPNQIWMDYLNWYKKAMQLPVENKCSLLNISPLEKGFELEFQKEDLNIKVKSRKVILATGRMGFGGPHFPEFVRDLPSHLYKHTSEQFDYQTLQGCQLGIIGVGASSFDAAAVALECGAESVDLIMRRDHIPNVNKFAALPYHGFHHGYCKLSDEKRWQFMCTALEGGIPPPIDSVKRVERFPNFHILASTAIFSAHFNGTKIELDTSQGTKTYDFLILGTGFHIDGNEQPELSDLMPHIALWKDRLDEALMQKNVQMSNFPYLGSSFEFLPKLPGTHLYLQDLYCYNYGATLSHGLVSCEIPAISIGATRLAQGIAADFFVQESDFYLEQLENYQEGEKIRLETNP